MTHPNGYVIYRGASLLDGAEIVVAATGFNVPSRNEKTGSMIQTWILRADVPPAEAAGNGLDSSVCGDCKHRAGDGKARSCYVQLRWGIANVWKAARPEGSYARATIAQLSLLGKGRVIRLGAYGDPAAVPVHIWSRLVSQAAGYTGYTHQWRKCDNQLKQLCMASVDSEAERLKARDMGWRTFRVRSRGANLMVSLPPEIECPASDRAGNRTTCAECRACGRRPEGNPSMQNRRIMLIGTGQLFPSGPYKFIGTVMTEDQNFVFHVFELLGA